MKAHELDTLKEKIRILHITNILFIIINIALIVHPIYYFLKYGFQLNSYFITITLLNILGMYASYYISDKLNYFNKKYNHFSNKLKS